MQKEPAGAAESGRFESAVRGLRWVGSARLFAQLVTWGLTIFTVRLLEPRDYGIVAISGLFTVLAGLVLDGGLSIVLISRREVDARVKGAAVSAVLIVGIALFALITAIAPVAAVFFHNPALVNVLRVSALQLPLTALTVVPSALLAKQMEFRELALAQSIASVVQGVATLSMAYQGAGYWALIVGTLLGIAVRAALQWGFLSERPAANLELSLLRPLWASGSQMVGQRALYFVASDYDTFLLGRLGGPVVLGSYALAKTLSHSLLDQLSGIVNQVSTPVFASKSDDATAQFDGLLLFISAAAALVFPLFWLMGVISQVAFPLFFGARWTTLIVPFVAFAAMLPLRSLYTLLDSAIVGAGQIPTTLRNMVTWAVIMIPLLSVGARYGANAAALSWVIGFPLVFWLTTRRIARAFQTRVTTLVQPMLRPALCAAASCLVVELAQLQSNQYTGALAQFVLDMALGGVCYVVLMRRYARRQYDIIMDLTRRLLGR
jgi:teichuronic acid exporter